MSGEVLVDAPVVCGHDTRLLAIEHSKIATGYHAGPFYLRPTLFVCPPADPDPCDCGHVGRWPMRTLFRRGLTDGEWQERCPGCGDVESFDQHGHVAQQRTQP